MIRNLLFLIFFSCNLTFGQVPVSVQQLQSREYSKVSGISNEKQWDSVNNYVSARVHKAQMISACKLKKVVFGWYPYWNGTNYNEFDFSLLSDIAYFSYEVNSQTGGYDNIHSWKTTPLVDLAKAAGTRVSLTATLFSGHKTFLENSKSRQTLIDSLISLVKQRGGQGVNIDFEAVPSSQRDNLTLFMKELGTQFHSQVSGSVISIALPAVDWGKTFDVISMMSYVDLFIIMGYDYYYSGSSKAGPVSPKNDGKFWTPYDVTRSVRYYLQLGVPNNKLCLGVPYYGYDWPTTDSLPNSNTSGSGTARIYNDAALTASYNGRLWDRHASVPYYAYTSGTSWRQCWYDDSVSLGFKYDMVNMCNIGGIGIWALGYDRTRQELWNLLREKFSSCGNTLCSGSFTDMGGPEGDYFAGDNYTFTIFQKDLGVISSVFTDFGMTANDSLIAYNGFNTQSAVIGRYTGVFPPKVVTSNSGALTFKFVSASTSTGKGWQAHWNCGNALPPDVLQLMPSRIPENQRQGTLIGRLQVPDSIKIQGGSLAFTGNDNSDQRYFRIHGDSLLSNVVFDYEKQNRYTVSISGSDIEGRAMWNNFDINVLDVNDPPFAINAIKDQTVQLGEPFKISFAGTYFFDEDFGDSLSISLSEDGNSKLPSWLDFDPKALQISGTPSGSEAQTIKLQLVALDRVGAKATLPFNLIIERPVGYVDSMTSEIMTFPNPTSGVITLLVSADFRVSPYVEIYKYNGLKVGQIRLTLDGLSRQKATVDLSSFPNGLYFLRLRAGNKVYINKVSLMKPR